MSGRESLLNGGFENDCCNCVEGFACLVATINSQDCCSTARDNIIFQVSPQSEPKLLIVFVLNTYTYCSF